MIANFFQNLNASKIEYLLISGHWRDIIGELKARRAAGKLMLEGSAI